MSDKETLVPAARRMLRDTLQDAGEGPIGNVLSAIVRNVDLPEQQRRIVGLIARGYTTAQIADKLGISVYTVANHRRAALLRLGLHGPVGLTHYAILRGLVQPGDVPGETGED